MRLTRAICETNIHTWLVANTAFLTVKRAAHHGGGFCYVVVMMMILLCVVCLFYYYGTTVLRKTSCIFSSLWRVMIQAEAKKAISAKENNGRNFRFSPSKLGKGARRIFVNKGWRTMEEGGEKDDICQVLICGRSGITFSVNQILSK